MAGNTIQFGLKINADTSDARAELNNLKQVLGQLGTGTAFKLNAKQEIREASAAAQQLQGHLAAATNKFGDFDINRFTASLKKGEMSLSEMSMKLMQIGPEGAKAFQTLSTQILNAQKPALSFSNILSKMGTTLMNNIRWQISSSAINAFTNSIREAWTYTKDMDKALTNIRVVTGKSREEMDKLSSSANKMAKELKSTSLDIVKGQLIFYQQGDSAELAAEKARIATMAANVSFESSQEEMADYLTAIWNSYQVGENQLELFVDKLSAVGAATATSMEEIATGMQKVAASANAVGVTYDQLNATIATISSVTRTSAESVGTAMKTIYARMGDLKLGKTDEDGITYGQVSSQMKQMGIDIADANGQLRDMGEVVEEIGGKWATFSKEEQQALVQAMAGKRQYTNLTALFENWDMYKETLEVSKNAMGTLQEQQDAWADSIEGASNRVSSSLEALYSRVINDDAIIDMVNGVAVLLEYFTGLIDVLGGLETILPLIGSLIVTAFAPQIINMFSTSLMNIRTIFGKWKKDLTEARNHLMNMANTSTFKILSADQQRVILQTKQLTEAQNFVITNSGKMTAAQKQYAQSIVDTVLELHKLENEARDTYNIIQQEAVESANTNVIPKANYKQIYGAAFNSFKGSLDSNIVSQLSGMSQGILDSNGDFTATKNNIDLVKQAIEEYNEKVKEINNIRVNSNIDEEFDKAAQSIGAAKVKIDDANRVIEALGTQKISTGEIESFKQSLINLGMSAERAEQAIGPDGLINTQVILDDIGDVDQLTQNIKEFENEIADTKSKVREAFDFDENQLEIAGNQIRQIIHATRDAEAGLKKIPKTVGSTSQGFLQMAGAASSAVMGVQSLTSSLESFKNGDWVAGLSGILMSIVSIGYALPQLSEGFKMVNDNIKGTAAKFLEIGVSSKVAGTGMASAGTEGAVAGMSVSAAWATVLVPILATIAAAAALGTAIWWMVKDFNEAETNAKSAAEQAKHFSDELNNANQELTDLKTNFENYNTKQSALSKMTEGTEEFKKALQEANEEVIDLITKYPELAEYVNDINGRLTITAEGQRKLLEAQQIEVDRAYANKLSSNIVAINARQEANEQALASKTLNSTADAVAGTVAAGLSGATIGAAIGTLGGPIGIAVGALIGGAIGSLGGYFGSGAKNEREHGLDKFTHAIETQGINILSSYKSLERALDGDTELARALWNNKEETNKLAKEIVANKKQIELNTKQLITINNPKIESSNFKNDIVEEGLTLAKDRNRSQIYADKMIKLLNGMEEQDAVDEYLKTMYGDEAHKYRIIDRFGTNSTLQKLEDGEWVTIGEKGSLSDDTIIENYRNKKAANLTEKEIAQITEKSAALRAKILGDSKDEVTQAIIKQYGKDAKSAVEAIKNSGKGFIEIYRETLKGQFDYTKEAWQEMINFELQNNAAFEGLYKAIKDQDTEALENYLTLFQDLGFFIGEDIKIFDKFNLALGKFADEAYTESALRKLEGIKEKVRTSSEVEFSSGFLNLEGVKEKQTETGGWEIVEGEEIIRTYLSSYFPPELIDQIMEEYLSGIDIGELFTKYFTKGIEEDIEDIILNDPTAIYSFPTDAGTLQNEYGISTEKANEFALAIEDLQKVQGAELKLNKEGQLILEKNGQIYDKNSISALAWESAINKTVLSADNFKNIGTELYNSIVSVGTAYGWTKSQTYEFLTALNSLNGANPDLSGFIDQCAIAGGTAMAALNSVLALHGVTVTTNIDPKTNSSTITVTDTKGNTKTYYPMSYDKLEKGKIVRSSESQQEFTARVYKDIINKNGISPKDLYTDFSKEWKELFGNITTTSPGITNPGDNGGDKKSASQKVFEAEKRKYDEELARAEADLEKGFIDDAQYREKVEKAWANLVSAYHALSSEEKAEVEDTMRSESLNIRQTVIDYFDNIYESWKDAYDYAIHNYGSDSKTAEINEKATIALQTLMATGTSRDLYKVYDEMVALADDTTLTSEEKAYAEERAKEIWDLLAGLDSDYTDYDYLDYLTQKEEEILQSDKTATYEDWQNLYKRKFENLKKMLEAGKISYQEFKKKANEIINAGYWDYDLGEEMPIFSFDEREEMFGETTELKVDYLQQEIDKVNELRDAYKALTDGLEEYKKGQGLSLDTFQTLLKLEPRYLSLLIDEEGQLNLNTDAVNNMTKAYIKNIGVKTAESLIADLADLETEEEALEYLGKKTIERSGSFEEVLTSISTLSFSDEVKNKAISMVKGIEELTEAAIQGVDTGIVDGEDPEETAKKSFSDSLSTFQEAKAAAEEIYKRSTQTVEDYKTYIDTVTAAWKILIADYTKLPAEVKKEFSSEMFSESENVIDIIKTLYKNRAEEWTAYSEHNARGLFDSKDKDWIRNLALEGGQLAWEEFFATGNKEIFARLRERIQEALKDPGLTQAEKEFLTEMDESFEEVYSDLGNVNYDLSIEDYLIDGIRNVFLNDKESSQETYNSYYSLLLDRLREKLKAGIISYQEYRAEAEKLITGVYWDHDANQWVNIFTGEEKLKLREEFDTSDFDAAFEALTNNLEYQAWRFTTYWEKQQEEIGGLFKTRFNIDFVSASREQFLDLAIEDQKIINEKINLLFETHTNTLNKGLINFEDYWKTRVDMVTMYSAALTEGEKQALLNVEKAAEDYVAILQTRYDEGELTLAQVITRIESIVGVSEYVKENNIFSFLSKEIDELFKRLEDKDFSSLEEYITEVVEILLGSNLTNEQFNKSFLYALNKGVDLDLERINNKYEGLRLNQEVANYGVYADLDGDGVGTKEEFEADLWQRQFNETLALKDWYEEHYSGTEDIWLDESYQNILTNIKELQDKGTEIANNILKSREDYSNRMIELGKWTIDDQIYYLNQTEEMLNNGYFDYLFNTQEDFDIWSANNSAELYKKQIELHEEKVKKIQEQLTEQFEFEKQLIEKQKKLEETRFNSLMELRDAQHEINLELQNSLTMYEYLDEETRKLIFNEEDYVTLSGEILKIQEEINDLTEAYYKKIAMATTEEAELLTQEYEDQVSLKMQEFEIAKANLEIAKKQMALQNTLNERNTRMFINGQWTWVANQESVAKAREDLLKAQYDAETNILNYEHTQAMNELNTEVRNIEQQINDLDSAVKDLEELINGKENSIIVSLEEFQKAIKATTKKVEEGPEPSGEWNDDGTRDKQKNIAEATMGEIGWDIAKDYIKIVEDKKIVGKTFVANGKEFTSTLNENGEIEWIGKVEGKDNKYRLDTASRDYVKNYFDNLTFEGKINFIKGIFPEGEIGIAEKKEQEQNIDYGIDRTKQYRDQKGNIYYFSQADNSWVSTQSGMRLGSSDANIANLNGISPVEEAVIASIEQTITGDIKNSELKQTELLETLIGEENGKSLLYHFETLRKSREEEVAQLIQAIHGIKVNIHNHYSSSSGNNESTEKVESNARGNIINRPTLSWVGEDGPEAIIPLSQKYRDRGLSLWEEATKALGIMPSFTMPTIRASFPQEKENMNVSQTINVTVQNEDSSNDFYAITNLL